MFMIPHQTLAGGLVGSYELTQFTNLLPKRLLGHRPTSDNKQIMWFGNRGSWHGNGVCTDPHVNSCHQPSKGKYRVENMHEGVTIGGIR